MVVWKLLPPGKEVGVWPEEEEEEEWVVEWKLLPPGKKRADQTIDPFKSAVFCVVVPLEGILVLVLLGLDQEPVMLDASE